MLAMVVRFLIWISGAVLLLAAAVMLTGCASGLTFVAMAASSGPPRPGQKGSPGECVRMNYAIHACEFNAQGVCVPCAK